MLDLDPNGNGEIVMKGSWSILIVFGFLSSCGDLPLKKGGQTDMGSDAASGNNVNNTHSPDIGVDPDMSLDLDTFPDPDMTHNGDSHSDMQDPVCGNGIVEPGEECDDGSNICGDDCQFICGNGVVDVGESCDIGIAAGQPGACPTTCDDGNTCTSNTLRGSACTAECVFDEITSCVDNDGCCAAGCDASNDNDCTAFCGNAVHEPGEVCDGNCPITCDDNNPCTTDVMFGNATTCDVVCVNTPISGCINQRWKITVVSATVSVMWDDFFSPVDPYVVVGVQLPSGISELSHTTTMWDNNNPVWNEVVLDDLDEDAFGNGVYLEMYNENAQASEEVCSWNIPVQQPLSAQSFDSPCLADPATILTWRIDPV